MKKFNKKSLGQNFLIDKNISKKITKLVKINNRNIIEIGPGKGALTDEILKHKPRTLTLIEKDEDLSKSLKEKYSKNEFVKNITADILNFDLEKLNLKNSIIIGNLPYNISSQILVKLLRFSKWLPFYSDIIFMFQKELGEKILGKFSTKNYGRISILTSYRLALCKKFEVSPSCFFPQPKIKSIVIHFKPVTNKVILKDIKNLEKVTQILFSNKRKMIKKNIYKILDERKIKLIKNLDLELRPSNIEPEIYYKITKLYETC